MCIYYSARGLQGTSNAQGRGPLAGSRLLAVRERWGSGVVRERCWMPATGPSVPAMRARPDAVPAVVGAAIALTAGRHRRGAAIVDSVIRGLVLRIVCGRSGRLSSGDCRGEERAAGSCGGRAVSRGAPRGQPSALGAGVRMVLDGTMRIVRCLANGTVGRTQRQLAEQVRAMKPFTWHRSTEVA